MLKQFEKLSLLSYKKKYKEWPVWAKMECPIRARSFSKETLDITQQISTGRLWNSTRSQTSQSAWAWGTMHQDFPGFWFVSLILQALQNPPPKNCQQAQIIKQIKLQEQPDSFSQMSRKGRHNNRKLLWQVPPCSNQLPRENLHPFPHGTFHPVLWFPW